MNRTLKAALLGGCAILLAGTARAADTGTVIAENGQWAVRQFTDNGLVSCAMSTAFPSAGVRVAVAALAGKDRLRVFVAYDNWRTPNTFVTRLDLVFDGAASWGQDGNARADANYVNTAISPQSTPAFVHAFTAGSTMQVTVKGAAPLSVGLTGTTASWGAFMDCAKISAPSIVAAISGLAQPFVAAAPAAQPATTEVGLLTQYGVKHVQGIAGRATPLLFILDSGAAVVQLPRGTAGQLALEGALVPTGRTMTVTIADGTETAQPIYMLRSLTVGSRSVTNIECVVTDRGDALLGQSFLSRLGSWSIDNARQTLVLGAAVAG